METNKVVISLSGGLDSTMLLMYYIAKGFDVKAYSFDYGQKHNIELYLVQQNVRYLKSMGYNIEHQIINLKDCFSDSVSALHENGGDIPHERYDADSQKSTVVEQRNVIFSSIIFGKALSWSKRTDSDVIISLGIHANDTSTYPDTTPESFEAARHLFKISNWGSERVDYEAPFQYLKKDEVLRAGMEAMDYLEFEDDDKEYILKHTHSCYDPDKNGKSCGLCGTCQERIACFALNDMIDPIEYNLTGEQLDELYLKYQKQGL